MNIDMSKVTAEFLRRFHHYTIHEVQLDMLRLLASAIERWESSPYPRPPFLITLYTGIGQGNTTMWKCLRDAYPDQVVVVSLNLQFAKHHDFDRVSLRTVRKFGDREDNPLKEKIIIFDVGGIPIPGGQCDGGLLNDLSKHNPKGFIIS